MDPARTVVAEAEAAALACLACVPLDALQRQSLRESLLLVVDVLGQVPADAAALQLDVLEALRRMLERCLATFDSARAVVPEAHGPLMDESTKANALLRALVSVLRTFSHRSETPTDVLAAIAAMLQRLCLQSLSTDDAMLLFDFLRVASPRGRAVVWPIVKALMEPEQAPRAVFVMGGAHTGIVVPSSALLFSKKGYSFSIGLMLTGKDQDQGQGGNCHGVVPLYSFRGSGGQGVTAVLDDAVLVVRCYGGQGQATEVSIPFQEWRHRMEQAWVHLCIVHAKKMVFKDKLAVFVNGTPVFSGNLPYPDPIQIVGGQNSICTAPNAHGFQGHIWSPTLFGVPLSDADIPNLHWLSHWKSDLNAITAENAGMMDKSRLLFSYDARSCDPDTRICCDVSGNECNGWMEPGTKACVTQGFIQALDSVGGCACFLLLLLDQTPEMAEFHPKHEFAQDEVSQLLAIVSAGLKSSVVCRSHFLRLHGVEVVAFILQSMAPQYLSVDVLESITIMLEAIVGELEPEGACECIHGILFRNANWFLCPYETQVKLVGKVLPKYLQLVQEMRDREIRRLNPTGTMEALGHVFTGTSVHFQQDLETIANVDVNFFCNLLAQVYSPQGTIAMESNHAATLRQMLIHNLINHLLFPPTQTDDAEPWRQLIAFIIRRCEKLTASSNELDSNGVDVAEILAYLTQVVSTDASNSSLPHQMMTKLGKISHGTLRLYWRPLLTPIQDIRLQALRLCEAICVDKVVLKRGDILVLHSALRAEPLSMEAADILLDLIMGRKHHSSHSGTSTGLGRSINVSRIQFLPPLLVGLLDNADFKVQVHVLYEVKAAMASKAVGNDLMETMQAWPLWLSHLHSIVARASNTNGVVVQGEVGVSELSAQDLNDSCARLSEEQVSTSSKLEALRVIARARDVRGCDFALNLFQNAEQPFSVSRAIVAMVKEQFPSRCRVLLIKMVHQIIVDVMVFSILHVQKGWIHFFEFFFIYCQKTSDLCTLTAAIVEKLLRHLASSSPAVQDEYAEVVWGNLSQVASIISLASTVTNSDAVNMDARLSCSQRQIFYHKAYDLWQVVIPRFSFINWGRLRASSVVTDSESAAEEHELVFKPIADASFARLLALESAVKHISAEIRSDFSERLRTTLEMLRLIAPSALLATLAVSTSPLPIDIFSMTRTSANTVPGTSIADSNAFLGEQRCRECSISREAIHLYVMDLCFPIFAAEMQSNPSFEEASRFVTLMMTLAATALHHQSTDQPMPSDTSKTLQIMASTDLTFFTDVEQLGSLLTLWQALKDKHQQFCDPKSVQSEIKFQHAAFMARWSTLVGQNGIQFNPYIVQRYSSNAADLLGSEVKLCEDLWREVSEISGTIDETDIYSENEEQHAALKRGADKFASSVHKLIQHAKLQDTETPPPAIVSNSTTDNVEDANSTASQLVQSVHESSNNDGILIKVPSSENAFRMRLRLKKVGGEEYRLRNLSCDSAFPETERRDSGRFSAPRRLCSLQESIEARTGIADMERSWRSDAGSDYNDFFSDAEMRAAIIRSSSVNFDDRDEYDSDMSDGEDDEVCADDADQEIPVREDGSVENGAMRSEVSQNVDSSLPTAITSSDCTPTPPNEVVNAQHEPTERDRSTSTSLRAISGFGLSMLNAVGGVADMVQKAAIDAKDAYEYRVDAFMTAKDAISDEAHNLVDEVTSFVDNSLQAPEISSAKTSEPPHSPPDAALPNGKKDACSDSGAPVLFPPPRQAPDGKKLSKNDSTESAGSSEPLSIKSDQEFDAHLVRHMNVIEGKLVLTDAYIFFIAERVVDEHDTVLVEKKKGTSIASSWRFLFKRRRWRIDDIAMLYRRRYLLKPTAIELFIQSSRKNYFFSLSAVEVLRFHECLMARRPAILKRDPAVRRLRHPSSIFRNSAMSTRWLNHDISTFEYLMWLNTVAGRTYNDLTQYPVFPWVIADYTSSHLDLARSSTFRNLSKPIGALEPQRLKFFMDRFNSLEDADIPKFMYGTHYSNIGAVLFYLIRLEPFTSYALSVQGGKLDHADRLFHSIADTWGNCLRDFNDLKELTPEWFYLPEFLKNCNRLDLGTTQTGVILGDVALPPWAMSAEDFVMKNYMALESEFVSANIHHWIDLVFGVKQRGPAAVTAHNVFFYLTYEGMVDVDTITDPVLKSSMRAQIAHFGQTPTQIVREPHPKRLSLEKAKRALASGNAPLERSFSQPALPSKTTLLLLPHDQPISLIHLVPTSSSMYCLDASGMLSVHRYGGKLVKVRQLPPTHEKERVTSSTTSSIKVTAMTLTSKGIAASAEQLHDQPAEYIELHDKKSHRISSDSRRRKDISLLRKTTAFINAGALYCTVGHHDYSARFYSSGDGALLYRLLQHTSVISCLAASTMGSLLALGCEDGTISVWRLAAITSTLLDSIKIFRASKSSAKPVQANNYAADQVLLGHGSSITCMAVSEELGLCVSGSKTNECLAHDLKDGSITRSYDIAGTAEPGILSLAVSPVGHLVVQSMGTGVPMLHAFHINGTFFASVSLGETPMKWLDICARYSKVITSNADVALSFSAHDLSNTEVLLERAANGEISCQAMAPDEIHVGFGVGIAQIVSIALLPTNLTA